MRALATRDPVQIVNQRTSNLSHTMYNYLFYRMLNILGVLFLVAEADLSSGGVLEIALCVATVTRLQATDVRAHLNNIKKQEDVTIHTHVHDENKCWLTISHNEIHQVEIT